MTAEDNNEETSKDKSSGVLFNFAMSTGMHGLPNIAASGGWFRRLFWILLTLAGLGVFIWQVYEALVKLLTYPTATTTDTLTVSPMYFPAVTLCNLNPVVYGMLKKMNTSQTRKMKSVIKTINDGPSADGPAPSNTNAIDWESRDQKNRRTDFTNSAIFFQAMNTLSNREFKTLAVKINDVLVDCSFEGKNCVPRDFVSFRDPRHGLCHTFNMVGENRTRRIVNDSGTEHALDLTLYVDQNNYVPDIITTAGYRIMVHDPFTPPLPEFHGVNVPPGFETTISVHTRVFSRETAPYGNCLNFTAAKNKSVNTLLNQLSSTQPTREICLRTCTQIQVIKACQCYSYIFGFTSAEAFKDLDHAAKNRPCSVGENSNDKACVDKVKREIASGKRTCKSDMCKNVECVSTRYDIKLSSLLWPAEKAFSSLMDEVKKSPNRKMVAKFDNLSTSATRTFIYRNFVKVKVYFSDLEMTFISTERSYELFDFIADFGGHSGLWLGFSILTFFEFIELVVDLFIVLHYKTSSRKNLSKRNELEMGNSKRIYA